jgi:hypothetical protein
LSAISAADFDAIYISFLSAISAAAFDAMCIVLVCHAQQLSIPSNCQLQQLAALSSGLRGSALAIELGCTHSIPTL